MCTENILCVAAQVVTLSSSLVRANDLIMPTSMVHTQVLSVSLDIFHLRQLDNQINNILISIAFYVESIPAAALGEHFHLHIRTIFYNPIDSLFAIAPANNSD